MPIPLDDPRLEPVKSDIRRALVSGYANRPFTEEGLLANLRYVYSAEIAWAGADVDFDAMVKSIPEFSSKFQTYTSPPLVPEDVKPATKPELK